MWDGSAVPIDENLTIAKELLKDAAAAKIILEIEIGVVGGEEDGVEAEINDKLYTTPEDFEKTIEALGAGEHGKYLLAATFGNVHGVYKPGNVKLRPDILAAGPEGGRGQARIGRGRKAFRLRLPRRFRLAEVGDRGVAALRRGQDERRHRHPVRVHPPVAGHMFTNYDGVLKIDGEVGNKKVYDPRSYMKKAEASMSERVVEACNDLHSAGRSA